MKRKSSTVKLIKARLAMAAFVLIMLIAIATTSAGVVGYALNSGASRNANQASAQVTSFSLQADAGRGN